MNSKLSRSIWAVKDDLRNNHKFGSNFQFWVSLLTSEIKQRTKLSEKQSHNLAINCILRISGNLTANYVEEEPNANNDNR